MTTHDISDNDFVIKVIQFLENSHGISFFITTKDFDVLYNWWEKRIPLPVLKESIGNVVERWNKKNKKINSFLNFSYEVKKNFAASMQLIVGTEVEVLEETRDGGSDELGEVEEFMSSFPGELEELRGEFESILAKLKKKEEIDLEKFQTILVAHFEGDRELEMKVKIFKNSLAPALRTPEIESRYRYNFLLNKYNIPDFETIVI
ncbi:MAG: hypothetical protein GY757_13810 [bacterium]|nr:hypothetical protein [bacterium]